MPRNIFAVHEDKQQAEIKRLKAAFIDASQLLTLEQLQQLSKQSALILKDMGFIGK